MTTKQFKGGSITLFDSIKCLPIERYQALNKYIIQDSGIGSAWMDVLGHFAKLSDFIKHKDIEAAALELENLHYNIYFILNGLDIKSRIFICFIESIGEVTVGNVEDPEEIERCISLLEKINLTIGDIQELTDEVKKKFIGN